MSAVPPESSAGISQYERILALGDQLIAARPWNILKSTDMLAIQHPDTASRMYLTVEGDGQDSISFGIYIDEEAIRRINLAQSWSMAELESEDAMGLLTETREISLAYQQQEELHPWDFELLNQLGRRYAALWPVVRSRQPGQTGAALRQWEADRLILALEQLLAYLPDHAKLQSVRIPATPGMAAKLKTGVIRSRKLVDGKWASLWDECTLERHQHPSPPCNEILAARLQRDASPTGPVECHFLMVTIPRSMDPGASFLYILACADLKTGAFLGYEVPLIGEEISLEELVASAPDRFLKILVKAGVSPECFHVSSKRTAALLKNVADTLGIKIFFKHNLPKLTPCLAEIPEVYDLMMQEAPEE